MILLPGPRAAPDVSNETKAGKSRLKSLMVLMAMGAAAYFLEWEWAVGGLLALYWAWRSTGWKGKALTLLAAPAVMVASVFPIEAVGDVVVHVAKGWADASGHPKGREKPHGWTDPSDQDMGRYYEDFLVNSGPLKGLGCERQFEFTTEIRNVRLSSVRQSWTAPGEVSASAEGGMVSMIGGHSRKADFRCTSKKARRKFRTRRPVMVEAKCLFPYGQRHGGNAGWVQKQEAQLLDYVAYCQEAGCDVVVAHCGPEPPWFRLIREGAGISQVRENYGSWRHELRLEAMMRVQALSIALGRMIGVEAFDAIDGG